MSKAFFGVAPLLPYHKAPEPEFEFMEEESMKKQEYAFHKRLAFMRAADPGWTPGFDVLHSFRWMAKVQREEGGGSESESDGPPEEVLVSPRKEVKRSWSGQSLVSLGDVVRRKFGW